MSRISLKIVGVNFRTFRKELMQNLPFFSRANDKAPNDQMVLAVLENINANPGRNAHPSSSCMTTKAPSNAPVQSSRASRA